MAHCFPISGSPPQPNPFVILSPIKILFFIGDLSICCLSVLIAKICKFSKFSFSKLAHIFMPAPPIPRQTNFMFLFSIINHLLKYDLICHFRINLNFFVKSKLLMKNKNDNFSHREYQV